MERLKDEDWSDTQAKIEAVASNLLSWFENEGSIALAPPSSERTRPRVDPQIEEESRGIYGLYIGQSIEEARAILGAPLREDPSSFGYTWHIYRPSDISYVQVGISDGKVVDIYSPSPDWRYRGIALGSTGDRLTDRFAFSDTVFFRYDGADFTVVNDVEERPLALVDDTPVLFYLDRHDGNKVAGIRFITKEYLVKSKLYSVRWNYLGVPPDVAAPTLTAEQQARVERAMERQIFELTNETRALRGLSRLEWNEQAAAVARAHSADMRQHQYFDHVSATTGLDPFERLRRQGVAYRAAGENIAMGYLDAIETHHGWMNSSGHRANILQSRFTTLGVGVIGEYSAQNFVTP